jgi:hypothetical protein
LNECAELAREGDGTRGEVPGQKDLGVKNRSIRRIAGRIKHRENRVRRQRSGNGLAGGYRDGQGFQRCGNGGSVSGEARESKAGNGCAARREAGLPSWSGGEGDHRIASGATSLAGCAGFGNAGDDMAMRRSLEGRIFENRQCAHPVFTPGAVVRILVVHMTLMY